MNSAINQKEFSVKYSSFDDAVQVRSLGLHCEMGKMDIKHAFCFIPCATCGLVIIGPVLEGSLF